SPSLRSRPAPPPCPPARARTRPGRFCPTPRGGRAGSVARSWRGLRRRLPSASPPGVPSQASDEEAVETATLRQMAGQGAHVALLREADGQTLELARLDREPAQRQAGGEGTLDHLRPLLGLQ